MPGDEVALGQDIHAFVYGRPLPYSRHLKYQGRDPVQVLRQGGSGNIPLMGEALLCATGNIDATRYFDGHFEASRETFMGRELQSRIYGVWHLLSILLVYAFGPSTLRAEAKAWLSCYASILYLTSDSRGRTCFGGMRSAGHDISHDAYEWILAVALGKSTSPWEHGWLNRWEYQVLAKLKPQLAEALASWRATNDKRIHLSGFKPMVPVHFTKTETAGCYWIESNLNGNTPPWLAAKVEDGHPAELMPVHGGRRIRQKFDHATCHLEGDKIVYKGELYPNGKITLPTGPPSYSFVWGGEVPPPPPPPPPVDPPETDDPPPSVSWWQRFKNWLSRIF